MGSYFSQASIHHQSIRATRRCEYVFLSPMDIYWSESATPPPSPSPSSSQCCIYQALYTSTNPASASTSASAQLSWLSLSHRFSHAQKYSQKARLLHLTKCNCDPWPSLHLSLSLSFNCIDQFRVVTKRAIW